MNLFLTLGGGKSLFNYENCQALGPGLCLIHFNSFNSLRLKTLNQRAEAIIQLLVFTFIWIKADFRL